MNDPLSEYKQTRITRLEAKYLREQTAISETWVLLTDVDILTCFFLPTAVK